MYLTVRGLVLRVTQYNDTDALLSVLTPSHGKLTIKARGLRRKNSPLTASCQLLAYSEFVLFEYRGLYTINEAHSIELFQNLRADLEKLSLGSYFAQVSEVISQEDIPSPELLSLLLNCLHALANTDLHQDQIKGVFELRSACLAGYMPELNGCWNCGNENAEMFDLSNGRTECVSCNIRTSGSIRLPISAGILSAMRYICMCDSKRIFSFKLGDETLKQLSEVTEGYLSTQLERGFSCLDFYKSLRMNMDLNS